METKEIMNCHSRENGNLSNKKNIPALRFPEFDGEWEEKKLGEVATITSGGTPTRNNPDYWNGNIPWVTTSLINFNIISQTDEFITEEGIRNSSAKVFEKGTILIALYGQGKTRGKVALLGINATTNQACAAIIARDFIYNLFLFQNFSGRYEEIRNLSNKGGQENLSGELIKRILVTFPSLAEQKKIAAFLTAVDEKLELLKKKKNLLEQYKKGVMQKIFSQEIRFKDESGDNFPDWEEKKGDEVFESISNKDHNSDLLVLAITQEFGAIPRDQIDFQISVAEKSVESYKVVEVGDFIISLRSFQGGIEYSNYKGICSPAYIILRPKISISDIFFKYYLKTDSYIKQLNKKLEGIRDGKMISYKYFSETDLPFPSLPEQTKIANFLLAIDERIGQLSAETDSATLWKKGLLQRMFC